MKDRRSKTYGGSQHQGSQLQCRAVRITSAPPPMSEDVFPPLTTPGRKMDLEKKEQPYLVGTKAGQMAVELEKLQDSSSGLCFLQDSQVLEGQAPPREL